ncbi:MAG: hypothetical protein K8Q91_02190 [Candidatus Vogelbacteria bacterium]|nr:hypothetical protein [Candidatus Vogelbacteria bacterium]
MYYKANLVTGQVEPIGRDHQSVWDYPGVKGNGQHFQLPGHALVEWTGDDRMKLWHPETDQTSGHVDIWYEHERRDGKNGIRIANYGDHELTFSSEGQLKYSWPSGGWSLIRVIDAVESHLQETLGGNQLHLRMWIELNFYPAGAPSLKELQEIQQRNEQAAA